MAGYRCLKDPSMARKWRDYWEIRDAPCPMDADRRVWEWGWRHSEQHFWEDYGPPHHVRDSQTERDEVMAVNGLMLSWVMIFRTSMRLSSLGRILCGTSDRNGDDYQDVPAHDHRLIRRIHCHQLRPVTVSRAHHQTTVQVNWLRTRVLQRCPHPAVMSRTLVLQQHPHPAVISRTQASSDEQDSSTTETPPPSSDEQDSGTTETPPPSSDEQYSGTTETPPPSSDEQDSCTTETPPPSSDEQDSGTTETPPPSSDEQDSSTTATPSPSGDEQDSGTTETPLPSSDDRVLQRRPHWAVTSRILRQQPTLNSLNRAMTPQRSGIDQTKNDQSRDVWNVNSLPTSEAPPSASMMGKTSCRWKTRAWPQPEQAQTSQTPYITGTRRMTYSIDGKCCRVRTFGSPDSLSWTDTPDGTQHPLGRLFWNFQDLQPHQVEVFLAKDNRDLCKRCQTCRKTSPKHTPKAPLNNLHPLHPSCYGHDRTLSPDGRMSQI